MFDSPVADAVRVGARREVVLALCLVRGIGKRVNYFSQTVARIANWLRLVM
jgi:hypothetical protein